MNDLLIILYKMNSRDHLYRSKVLKFVNLKFKTLPLQKDWTFPSVFTVHTYSHFSFPIIYGERDMHTNFKSFYDCQKTPK